jgi:tetratricopeptide (TPR) repeat protein
MRRTLAWARQLGLSVVRSVESFPRSPAKVSAKAKRRLKIAAAIVVPLIAAPALSRVLFQRQMILDKLQRSREECHRADENLLLAMATFGDRIDHLGIESKLLAKEELAFYKTIYDSAVTEPSERFAVAMARRRAGAIQLQLGQREEARLCYMLAIHMLEELSVEKPEPQEALRYRHVLAETYVDDAERLAKIGDIAAAEARYHASLDLLAKLSAKTLDGAYLLISQARVLHSRGAMLLKLQRYPEAEADLQRALAIRLPRINAPTDSWLGSPVCQLSATWLQLGQLYRATRRTGEAIGIFQQALAAYASLGRYQADVNYCQDYAAVLEGLAGAYSDAGEEWLARDSCRRALAVYDWLNAQYPEIMVHRERRAQLQSFFRF